MVQVLTQVKRKTPQEPIIRNRKEKRVKTQKKNKRSPPVRKPLTEEQKKDRANKRRRIMEERKMKMKTHRIKANNKKKAITEMYKVKKKERGKTPMLFISKSALTSLTREIIKQSKVSNMYGADVMIPVAFEAKLNESVERAANQLFKYCGKASVVLGCTKKLKAGAAYAATTQFRAKNNVVKLASDL